MKKILLGFLLLCGAANAQDIVITEIMYNPPEAGTDTAEFIEFYNNGASPVDLTDYTVTGVTYTFPSVTLSSGDYFVLAVNTSGFTNTYGFAPDGTATGGGTSNGGELIELRDNNGTLVDEVDYDDNAPWPSGLAAGEVDGGGASLRLCDEDVDNNDGNNWSASTTTTGMIVNGLEIFATPGSAGNCCSTVFGTDTQTACESFSWIDGNTYTSSNNTATHTIVNGSVNGCDSVVTLDLTILSPTTGTDVQTACGSFAWIDGNTYTSNNNTATHTITNGAANGCDSIVTLDLTILQPVTGTDIQTPCGDSFTWIDGNTYTANNNTATHTLTNGAANGCDSVVTLNLTFNFVDVSVTTSGNTITANLAGADYQWIDCSTNTAISGETNQSYTATTNGSYAVVVDDGTCADTSICETITGLGITNSSSEFLSVSPNPSTGQFQLSGNGIMTYTITDLSGKIIFSGTMNNTKIIDLSTYESGVYLLIGQQDNFTQTLRLIKQ